MTNNVSISNSFEQLKLGNLDRKIMYQAVSAILEKYDVDVSTAEAHGIAVGMLCVDLSVDADGWMHELFVDEHDLSEDERAVLSTLFVQSRDLLDPEAEEFKFDLFLPNDDEDLSQQVEALRCWCQGFLFGVGRANIGADWPGDSAEVMRDLIELTKIDSDVDGEEDEEALMEIHEYLRVAVLTVRDQFAERNRNVAN
jgi:uncharacterized protein YgfB (UPF0149 family)